MNKTYQENLEWLLKSSKELVQNYKLQSQPSMSDVDSLNLEHAVQNLLKEAMERGVKNCESICLKNTFIEEEKEN